MLRYALAVLAALTVCAGATEASPFVSGYCPDLSCSRSTSKARVWVKRHRVASVRKAAHRHIAAPGSRKPIRTTQHGSGSLVAVIGPLAAKAEEIVGACGSQVVSAHRPGARIAGSGHYSLHARYPSRAVDLAGNPGCIYGRLKGWPGGYSTDYRAVAHVHISYDPHGKEWGARFVHNGGYRSTQYARRYENPRSAW